MMNDVIAIDIEDFGITWSLHFLHTKVEPIGNGPPMEKYSLMKLLKSISFTGEVQ